MEIKKKGSHLGERQQQLVFLKIDAAYTTQQQQQHIYGDELYLPLLVTPPRIFKKSKRRGGGDV